MSTFSLPHLPLQKFFNSLPNGKILDESKFKAYVDDKIILTQNSKLLLESVENMVEKGENAGYQHFLLFSHNAFKCFPFQRC